MSNIKERNLPRIIFFMNPFIEVRESANSLFFFTLQDTFRTTFNKPIRSVHSRKYKKFIVYFPWRQVALFQIEREYSLY